MFDRLKIHLAQVKARELHLTSDESEKLIKAFALDEEWAIQIVLNDSVTARTFLYKEIDEELLPY